MVANGVNPGSYQGGILELGKSVPESLSKYIGDYKPFLLSKSVDYDELYEYSLYGAKGYLEDGELVITEEALSDKNKVDFPFEWREFKNSVPKLDDFDVVCSYIDTDSSLADEDFFNNVFRLENQELYMSFIFDREKVLAPEHKLIEEYFYSLGREMFYYVCADNLPDDDKRVYLVKKIGKKSTSQSIGNLPFYK